MRLKSWEVYNDAPWTKRPSTPVQDRHISYHWTRFGAVMQAQNLRRQARAMGYSAENHVYEVRRRA